MIAALLSAAILIGAPQEPAALGNATAIRDALDSRLTDYPSARFRRVRVAADGSHVCGEVNARGPAGGYEGWKPLIIEGAQSEVPDIQIAQAPAVAREFLTRCEARRDWRPSDYSKAIAFTD